MKGVNINRVLLIAGIIPLVIWSFLYLQSDLWYDEIYTLEQFVLTNWVTTLRYYPAPNNHIFHNLLLQALTRITGLRDIVNLTEYVSILRIFHLLIVLFTAYYASKIVSIIIGSKYSNWVYIILFTTIPFLNFSLQIRGYALSGLLLTALLYYIIRQLCDFPLQLQIILLSFLLLYTIPSNLYIIASIWVIIFTLWMVKYRENYNYRKILFYVATGVIIAIICYLPVIDQVINNKFSSREAPGTFYMAAIFKHVFYGFISNRYPFILPAIIAIILFYLKKKNPYFIILSLVLLLPFGFAFLHQKAVFERTFIPLAPVFASIVTISFIYLIEEFTQSKNRIWFVFIASSIWIGISVKEIFKNYHSVSKTILSTYKPIQNSYQNYYLSSIYKQDEVAKKLARQYSGEPVFLYKIRDKYSTKLYLEKNNIPFQTIDSLAQITQLTKKNDRFYIITFNLPETLKELNSNSKNASSPVLNKPFFSNIIVCNPKSSH